MDYVECAKHSRRQSEAIKLAIDTLKTAAGITLPNEVPPPTEPRCGARDGGVVIRGRSCVLYEGHAGAHEHDEEAPPTEPRAGRWDRDGIRWWCPPDSFDCGRPHESDVATCAECGATRPDCGTVRPPRDEVKP